LGGLFGRIFNRGNNPPIQPNNPSPNTQGAGGTSTAPSNAPDTGPAPIEVPLGHSGKYYTIEEESISSDTTEE